MVLLLALTAILFVSVFVLPFLGYVPLGLSFGDIRGKRRRSRSLVAARWQQWRRLRPGRRTVHRPRSERVDRSPSGQPGVSALGDSTAAIESRSHAGERPPLRPLFAAFVF